MKNTDKKVVVIDCNILPFVPFDVWKVEEHQKGGISKFDISKMQLYFSDKQKEGKIINGNDLRKELKEKRVLNANVIDYLLENQDLIPKSWRKSKNSKKLRIFFWGTIYNLRGDLCVRCIELGENNKWGSRYYNPLDNYGWDSTSPAIIIND